MTQARDQALTSYDNLDRLVRAVTAIWPDHAAYLAKSMSVRPPELLATSDLAADAILRLSGDRIASHAADYRWLCDLILGEELFFAREDRYRYSTFAETNAAVYSDDVFMARYMNGLMLSHVLWAMHASSLHFYVQRIAARVMPAGSVLEIGSGHGLLLFLALNHLGFARAHGWDLSPVSLEQTRHALETLGAADRATLAIQDMRRIEAGAECHDLVILSHILEHLEDPVAALLSIRPIVRKGGHLFVNVPLNAPWPDHITLLRDPQEVLDMLSAGGFRVSEIAMHTVQNVPLSKALRQKTAVTCSVIAEPA